jgi:hypothetical protein
MLRCQTAAGVAPPHLALRQAVTFDDDRSEDGREDSPGAGAHRRARGCARAALTRPAGPACGGRRHGG